MESSGLGISVQNNSFVEPQGNLDKKCIICGKTSKNIFNNLKFIECQHIYCEYCLFRTIFKNNINELIEKNEIIINCKCNKGKLKLSLKQIDDIIKFKSNIDEEQDENYIPHCDLHNSDCDLFCKNCEKYICYSCRNEPEHKNHKFVLIKILVRMYKEFIKGMPLKFKYSEEFKLNLDKSVDKFCKELAEKTNAVIKNINFLIEELNKIKNDYIKKIKEIQEYGLESLNLIKSFYFEFYHDLSNIDNDNDIFSLRYMAHFNSEIDNFEMKYNIGILKKLEDIKNQSDIFKSWIENPFSIKINFREIPKTFREVIRALDHEGSINCLTKIGNNQFVSGSSDNSIKFWNLDDVEFKPYDSIDKFTGTVGTLLLLKDDRLCSTSINENWIKVYEKIKTFLENNEKNVNYKYNISLTLSEHKMPVTSIIELENNFLISGSKDEKIIIWKPDGTIFNNYDSIQAHKGGVYSLCKLKDNEFASGGFGGIIKLWKNNNEPIIENNNTKYYCYQVINGHKDKIRCLILLNNNNLCSGSDDCSFIIWKKNDNNKKYEIFWTKEIKNEKITCLCELKNGFLLTGSNNSKSSNPANLRVWEPVINSYEKREKISKHYKNIKSIIELDWGNVASAGEDGVIIIWKNGVLFD